VRQSKNNAKRATEIAHALQEATQSDEAYAHAITNPDCIHMIHQELERIVEYVCRNDDAHADVFLFSLADLVKFWAPVISERQLAWVATELRGAKALKGMASVVATDGGETFGELVWWPA